MSSTMPVPCYNCGRIMQYPATHVRMRARRMEPLVVFCSSKCNQIYVARQGQKDQDRAWQEQSQTFASRP